MQLDLFLLAGKANLQIVECNINLNNSIDSFLLIVLLIA